MGNTIRADPSRNHCGSARRTPFGADPTTATRTQRADDSTAEATARASRGDIAAWPVRLLRVDAGRRVIDGVRAPARYFPVSPKPLHMRPGLRPFPTELGNGELDRLYFQLDRELDRYVAAKRAPTPSGPAPCSRHRIVTGSPARERAHAAALAWIDRTLRHEHPGRHAEIAASEESYASEYDRILRNVQEDLVVMHRVDAGHDEAIMLHVCFPSGWYPERVAARGFRFIHAPVPDFADSDDTVASMLSAMIERGPYLRFVWTLAADDELDHHPTEGNRSGWDDASEGWLRVERQVTVPLPDENAALFLIRTYLYRFDSLGTGQRAVLAEAIRAMPDAVRRYKGFSRERALAALARCGN